jgi:hypothetical protein
MDRLPRGLERHQQEGRLQPRHHLRHRRNPQHAAAHQIASLLLAFNEHVIEDRVEVNYGIDSLTAA